MRQTEKTEMAVKSGDGGDDGVRGRQGDKSGHFRVSNLFLG